MTAARVAHGLARFNMVFLVEGDTAEKAASLKGVRYLDAGLEAGTDGFM